MRKAHKFFCTLIVIVILTSVFISLWKLDSYAITQENKFVLIVINRTHFKDMIEQPTLKSMIEYGSIGLMNTRASSTQNDAKSYATIGWGVRAEADNSTSIFHEVNDANIHIYNRRTGNTVNEGYINLHINQLISQNIDGDYGATPGILGELLAEEDLKTVLIGNSDTDTIKFSPAGLMIMNKKGHIAQGDIGNSVIEKDLSSPFGMKTNYEALLDAFNTFYENTDLIIIETGDMNRLQMYNDNLNKEMYAFHKNNIMNEIDSFIAALLEQIDLKKTQIMVLSPFPGDEYALLGDRLTPVIYYGHNITPGVVSSSTTRRTGIVGNVDIAPTILNYLNVESKGMIGNHIITIDMEANHHYIFSLNQKVVSTSIHRYRVLYTFAIFQMIISILSIIAILLQGKYKLKLIKKILAYSLISTLVFPFTLLVLPILGPMNIVSLYLIIICITIAIVLIIYALSKESPLRSITYVTGLVMVTLVIDLVLGQSLIKNSIFGYDPIIGARYYGIGNEYMGILIGSTLIFTATLLDLYKVNYKYIAPVFFTVLIAIGLPIWGANVGGTITAATVFIFAYMRFSNKKITLKKVMIILGSVGVILAIISLVDLYLFQNRSHLAGAIQQMIDHGPRVIFQVIRRKLLMNLRIMSVTVWSRVLLIAMIILAVLFYHPIGIFKKLTKEYPYIMVGLGSIILGSKVAFLVNDSGIVAAATIMMFLTTTILYLIISDYPKFTN